MKVFISWPGDAGQRLVSRLMWKMVGRDFWSGSESQL